jgi:proteasome lid subunit RPN8/RPN11
MNTCYVSSFSRKAVRETAKTKKALLINQSVIDSILSCAKACHPNEGILILKGKTGKDEIVIDEVEIPPLAVHGQAFSNFPCMHDISCA